MKSIAAILVCSCFTFFSCSKKKTTTPEDKPTITTDLKAGFPDDIRAINGYFYAQLQRYNGSSGYNSYNFSCYSTANDPARNLTSTYDHYNGGSNFSVSGNVDVGPVMFNDIDLTPQNFGNSISYQTPNSSLNFSAPPSPVIWKTKGNASFKPLEINVTRGFPVIINTYTNTSQGYTLSASNGYTINFGDIVSNYDSLIISIQAYGSTAAKKKLIPGLTSVSFSSSDLSPVLQSSSYATLNIYAYNYSNKITENVCNVFELSNKLTVNISVLP